MTNGGCYKVVSIVGPTASGKSALADELAVRLQSEVVSADAMQVYRSMDIGTAKTPLAQRRAPLRCVDLVDPGEPYSVALFADASHAAIDAVIQCNRVPVVCGGTGLYVRAALENMEFPAGEQVENLVRQRLEERAELLGPVAFHAELSRIDPQSAALIHPNNVRRVVRAFELLEQGTSYAAEHETLHVRTDRYPTLHIGLHVEREVLYERINRRVDQMIANGLLDEVSDLVSRGLADTLTARQAIGYKEFIDVLVGNRSLEEAVEEVKRSTRRYAKRQLTWFKADPRIQWIAMTDADVERAVDIVMAVLNNGSTH